jgi:mRNA-degrading endonuclease RelE of RelBE toxin-antitoxin system
VRVRLSAQVVEFVQRQAPEPRKLLRRALKQLGAESGDIKGLEGPLDGYCRLRVGAYRIIFSYSGRRTIDCVFAERRNIVYEVFAEALAETLAGRGH